MAAVCLHTCSAFLLQSTEQMNLWPHILVSPRLCNIIFCPLTSGIFSFIFYVLMFSSINSAKEIQLMHRAPVVGVVVLDGHGAPLPEPLEVAHDLARSPDMHGSHHLVVISEEQFKVSLNTNTLLLFHTLLIPQPGVEKCKPRSNKVVALGKM